MNPDEFSAALTEAINLEGVTLRPETVLRDAPGWDSLAVLLTIAFAEERFGQELSDRDIAGAVTVEGLRKLLDGSRD